MVYNPAYKGQIKLLHPYAKIPEYSTPGSSGMDVYAIDDGILYPGEIKVIPFGIAMAVPRHYEIQVRARSGLAAKFGIGMVNGVGTVDSDYRGEIKGIFCNHGKHPWKWIRGDRIAQLVVQKLYLQRLAFGVVDEFAEKTRRGEGGFGSTGD